MPMMWFTWVSGAFALILLSIAGAVYGPHYGHRHDLDKPHPFYAHECQVFVIYDGDTLGCDFDQDHRVSSPQEKIRLLHIDTPEMHYSPKNHSGKNQPYALEAKQWLSRHVLRKTIHLEFDENPTDRYGRQLGFVYLQHHSIPSAPYNPDQMINLALVKSGYAKLMVIAPNTRYLDRFEYLEAQARKQHLGIWSQNMP